MKIDPRIKEAINKNNLVVFAGSGLSFKFNLPSWNKLVEDVIKTIDKEEHNVFLPVLKIGAMKPIEVLQKIKTEHSTIKQYIKNEFNVKNGDLETHKKIISLTNGQVITTNYDNAFEKATNGSIAPSIHTDNFNISQINKNNEPYIFKLHGSHNEPSNCIIFEEDYTQLYKSNTGAIEKLKIIFAEKTILFLGFSFNDPDINLIFENLDKAFDNNNKHFIITKEPKEFNKFNFLTTIEISDFKEIDAYLDTLIEYKSNQDSIVYSNETKIEKKQKIAILTPNPIDLNIDNELNKVKNNFNSIDTIIYQGYLNIKTLLSIEDFDLIVIISKVYKSNIYIEEDNLQSKLLSISEICENIPNDNIPLIFTDYP